MSGLGELERFLDVNRALLADGLVTEVALDGPPFEAIETPTDWRRCAEFRVTAEVNDLYCATTEDDDPRWRTVGGRPALVNPIVLIKLGTRPVLREFPVAIPDGQSSLNAKLACRFLAPSYVGTAFVDDGRLVEKYVRRGRRYLVTEGRISDDEGRAVLGFTHTRMVGREA